MASKWIDIEIDGISGQYKIDSIDRVVSKLQVRRIKGVRESKTSCIVAQDSLKNEEWKLKKVKMLLNDVLEIEEELWD